MFKQFFLLILLTNLIINTKQICQDVKILCNNQQNCKDCIRIHHCCNWCYQKDFSGLRCDLKDNLKCPNEIIENSKAGTEIIQDEPFNDVYNAQNFENVVQIRPQKIFVKLKKDEPLNVTIKYKAAKNYPLDLYYLMDLTWSMRKDLNTTTQLGLKLTQVLSNLTKNHKIAFGSYVDKKAMPFYLTDEVNYKNPCNLINQNCSSGYLFKHNLNFTKNIELFIRKVNKSVITANVDNLEGGLDALMQILICNKQLKWSERSRKIVILATESEMHLAGDGLLVGAIARNTQCLLSPDGHYDSLIHDYPSLEEIHRQLLTRKINVIFAVKGNLSYYKELNKAIPDSTYVGQLEKDSTNILELVKEGYYDFMKRVKLNVINATKGLNVEFFADCYGTGVFQKTSNCYNAEEGKPIKFKVQLFLNKYQDEQFDVLYIEEKNIQEKIRIDIEYIDLKCNCPSMESDKNCINGQFVCGNCSCFDGWTGDTCEDYCATKLETCRYKDQSNQIHISCFGNGDCICGKCQCHFPFTGEFCRYACPIDKSTKLICGGTSRGSCIDGICICEKNYKGIACSCPLSQENCKAPGESKICNEHGKCECNKCQCDEGYEGQFCEICSDCEGLCNIYLNCVSSFIHNGSKTCIMEDKAIVSSEQVDHLNPDMKQYCYYRYNNGQYDCDARFSYTLKKGGLVHLQVEKATCRRPFEAGMALGVIIGGILALGFLVIVAWKGVVTYKDRIEYQKFKQETKRHQFTKTENPLYKSPIVEYRNPISNLK